MADALEDHEGSCSIGGRTITNSRFADGSGALARKKEEIIKVVNQLGKKSTTHAMEISAEKTKLMTNDTREISSDIRIGGQNLETFQSFKYLGQMFLYHFGKGHSHTKKEKHFTNRLVVSMKLSLPWIPERQRPNH